MISKASFGMTSEGDEAFLYTLTTEKGMTIKVTNYGAALCSVSLQDKDGKEIDVANHPKMIVKFEVPFKLSQFDMMRIKVFDISLFL